jgi:ribosomal protein S18 acetylase RimI-like enzyme
MTDLDPKLLLAAYDAQLRARVPDPLPDGVTVERDGPLLRILGYTRAGFLTYTDLGGLDGAELDALIARQRDHFAERGTAVEWKLHGHDRPADLPERLRAASFEPEAQETVVVGPVAGLAATQPVTPQGVRLREVRTRADLERISAMEEAVWGTAPKGLVDRLERELSAPVPELTVVVAEADGEVVSAGWVRFERGTAFASLWGGSTLVEWRRRGIYRALVTYRARLAGAQGFTVLQVDASDESRPILERLGFVALTTTTPYVFTP